MATAGSIVIDLLARTSSFETDMQRASRTADREAKRIASSARQHAQETERAWSSASKAMVASLGAISVGAIFTRIVQNTKNAADEQAQLAAVLRSTGQAAGWSADQLNTMAASMSRASAFSAGEINKAQTTLLAFTGIVGAELPKALQSAMDMAARTGMSVVAAAETIGRALDIPSQGLTALSRQGFRFTEDQKQLAEQLESTGRTAEAQGIILNALTESYGGAAEAARGTLGGALAGLTNSLDDLLTGSKDAFTPIIDGIEALNSLLASGHAETALYALSTAAVAVSVVFAGRLVGSLAASATGFAAATIEASRYQMALASMAGVSRAAAVGIGGVTAAARAGSAVMGIFGGPVGLVATIGLTAAGFVAMGGSAKQASLDVEALAASFQTLSQNKLEVRRFELEDEVKRLEDQARESAEILQGLENDVAAVFEDAANGVNITAKELDNARRALLEQREAHDTNSAALDRSRTLLDQVVVHLQNLQGAAIGAAGGVNALNQAMFSEAGGKYLAQIQGRIKALQDSGDPIKIASRYIAEHTELTEADRVAILSAAHAEKALMAARDAAAKSTKSGTRVVNEAKRAAEAFRKEQDQSIASQYQSISAIHDQALAMEDQVALYGQSATAIEDLTIARLVERSNLLAIYGGDAANPALAALEAEIEGRKRLRTAMGSAEQKEAERASWNEWAQSVEQIFGRVGQSLTDAIFEGGKSGKELLKDVFKGLTFSIAINPVMQGLQGAVTNSLGGFFGQTNPQQQSAGGFDIGSLFTNFGGSVANTLTNFGSSLASSTSQWTSDIGASLVMNADSIGSFASTAGNVLGYGKAVFDAVNGKWGSAAGTAIGTYFGGPIGGAIGSTIGGFVDDAFGGGPPKTRHGQRTTVDYSGGAFGLSGVDDRQAAGAEQAALAAAESTVKAANDLFARIGVNAGIESFYAIMESSVLGDRDGVASGGSLRVGDQMRQIGVKQSSDMTLAGFGGWSSAEMLPRLQTDIQLSVLEAFQAVGDELPSVLGDMLEGVYVRGLDGPAAQELAARFAAVADGATTYLKAIEALPFAQLRDLSFNAAAGLVQLAGGVENLLTSQQTYFENFYSEAERYEIAVGNLATSLAGAGIEMPGLIGTADEMRMSYRALVEAQDLNTESGRQAYVALMGSAGAFSELVNYAGQAAQVVEEVAEAVRSAADIARERLGLEGQLLSLQGDTAEIRRRELAALDESNHALQQHIWAIQDAYAAEEKLAQKRQQVWDAAVAAGEAAYSQLSRAVSAEKSRLQRESQAIADALRGSISAASSTVSELTSLTGRLTSTVQRMIGQGLDEGRNRAWAQDRIDRALSVAKLTGVMPQGADFEAALQMVAEPSEGLFTSFEDYQADFLKTAHTISGLNELAEGQLSTEKRALKALEDQLSNSQQLHQAEMERLDQMLEMERQRLDLALGVHETVLTIPAALAAIAAAIGSIQAATPPSNGGGGGAGGGSSWNAGSYLANNPDVAAAYVQYGQSYGHTPESWAAEHYAEYGKDEGRKFARGGYATPGWAMVGEEGPELVNFSQPGRVYTANQTNDILRNMGVGAGDQTIRLLQQEVRELRVMLERKLDEGNRNTGEVAKTNRQMIDQPQQVEVTNIVRNVAVTPGT